jgi:hypothetical protein
VPTEFRLRFPLSEVMYWAARYAYADDVEVEAIGKAARERGWFTRDEFLTVARWKSPRSRRLCEENHESEVKAATQLELSTLDERKRVESLTRLRGVDYPTASVLLHLAHRDPYPIIDFRALWSLSVETPPTTYSFTFLVGIHAGVPFAGEGSGRADADARPGALAVLQGTPTNRGNLARRPRRSARDPGS